MNLIIEKGQSKLFGRYHDSKTPLYIVPTAFLWLTSYDMYSNSHVVVSIQHLLDFTGVCGIIGSSSSSTECLLWAEIIGCLPASQPSFLRHDLTYPAVIFYISCSALPRRYCKVPRRRTRFHYGLRSRSLEILWHLHQVKTYR